MLTTGMGMGPSDIMAAEGDLSDDIFLLQRSDVTSAAVLGIAELWDRARDDQAFASRAAFHAFALRRWLPYIVITDIHHDPFRVRYRLVGTALVEANKQDYTGIWLAESGWPQETIDLNMALYRRAAETREPVFGLSKVKWDMRLEYRFEWAIFPLSDDGAGVTQCLGIDDYASVERDLLLQTPKQ